VLALVEAQRAGLLGARRWFPNIVSGVIVGVVALPLAMAFAIASGAKPEQGIYTAIIAGLIVSAAGGSRVQIAGPTGAFIVILADITARYGIEGLQIATLMAGVILLLLGLARMGTIIRFIPDPVIIGFTAGIAVIIFVGQWKTFLGLPAVTGTHFHEQLPQLIAALPRLHPTTAAIAILSLALVVVGPKLPGLRRIPGPLLALVVATVLQATLHFEGVSTIGSAFGGIPQGLPSFSVPDLTLNRIVQLVGPAFTIAMLGAIESLLSAVVADGMAGTRHDSNQELVGQGLANIATPFFGGFAATGAIARTATNIRNGGTSPIAGIVHSLTLVLVILFLAPLAVHVPQAALAAILFVVAWHMSDAKRFVRMMRRAPPADIVILLVTFGLTVFADLVVAVNIGVILAMLQFVRRMSTSVEVREATEDELRQEFGVEAQAQVPPGVVVYSVDGPFFFGAAEAFEHTLAATHTDPRVLIIRLRWVPFIDITGLHRLEEIIANLKKRGVRVVLCGANERVSGKLAKAGITGMLGDGNNFKDLSEAVNACRDVRESS
jgi:SulP family sulfate permease